MIVLMTVMILILRSVISLQFGIRVQGMTCTNDVDCNILMTEAENELSCFRLCIQHNLCNLISYDAENKRCSLFLFLNNWSMGIPTGNVQNGIQHYKRIKPQDCGDLFKVIKKSGVYRIYTSGSQEINVACDMDTDGGGWTVIQRRQDGSIDFYRDWNSYKNGFGDLKSEFWLGNENTHKILTHGNYTLRIDLEDFEGSTRFAKYSTFYVGPETSSYTLDIAGYTGNAGDVMTLHKGCKFTTKDRDNDVWGNNCAVIYKGAWWYRSCHTSNLNGQYLSGNHKTFADGVNWKEWRGYYYSLKSTTMMIRK